MSIEIGNLLERLVDASTGPVPATAQDDFHTIAQAAQPEALSQGLTEAFKSDETPPFGNMVAHMFGQANPEQKAGIVNHLLRGFGPAAAAVLSRVGLQGAVSSGTTPTLSPEQASQISTTQVQQIATQAKTADPGIVESMSNFYAQHPVLVKSLGAAALAVILGKIGTRTA